MTLQNLLGRTLESVEPDALQIARLLAAVQRNLADAGLTDLSSENRFDAAYKAVMQLSMVALNAHGFRPATSRPGHHQTAIQTLALTVGYATNRIVVLDALRKQRNLSDYSGDLVSDSAARTCIEAATELRRHVLQWLREHRPQLSPNDVGSP